MPNEHSQNRNSLRLGWCAVVLVLLLGACASRPEDPALAAAQAELNDPLEPVNRVIFDVNEGVDIILLRPVAVAYREVVPEPLRNNVQSFLRNLRSPLNFGNEVLQGDFVGARDVAARFLINSTIGFLGLADVAETAGFPYVEEDLGQTFAVWGAGEGAYLVLPLLGPSSVRDGIGFGIESAVDPVRLYLRNNDLNYLIYTRLGLTAVDSRSRVIEVVDDLRANSIDYYAAVRSLWRQNRRNAINDGVVTEDTGDFPEFNSLPDRPSQVGGQASTSTHSDGAPQQ